MSPAPILISTLYHYPISILNHCYPMPYIHPNASTEELVHTAITTSVPRLAFSWLFVGVPLAWGVYETLLKSLALFI